MTTNVKTLQVIISRLEKQRDDLDRTIRLLRMIEAGGAIDIEAVSFDAFEKRVIASALDAARGSQVEAARILKMGRDRLRYKMKKYRLRW